MPITTVPINMQEPDVQKVNVSDVGAPNGVATLDANGNLVQSLATPSGGVSWVASSANQTAVVGEGYMSDTSAASFTITLPATPALGDEISFMDSARNWQVNNLIISDPVNLISGSATDLVCNVNGKSFSLVFAGATTGWGVA